MALKLIIGNKNYSSWSFRPWIAMKVAGIAFDEEVISLDAEDFKQRVRGISGTGKVPALADGGVQVWESLAILEYLAEKFPDARLWPADPAARALARAIVAEMHAGFVPLRRHLPMNMWRPVVRRDLTPEVAANVRASRPCGPIVARATAGTAPSCSAPSEPPTPCTRRSSPASTPTPSRSARSPAPTWTR